MFAPFAPESIANHFIFSSNGRYTQLELQKLVYFAHGWTLVAVREPLVAAGFEAWQYGPVNRELYVSLNEFGNRVILNQLLDENRIPFPIPDDEQIGQVLKHVRTVYGELNAAQMVELTHAPGTPWAMTHKKGLKRSISDVLIQAHFDEIFEKTRGAADPAETN